MDLTGEVAGEGPAVFKSPKSRDQVAFLWHVRRILAGAVKQIIADVPAGPDRTVALHKIREARMDCNSAITHGGKY